VCTKTYSKPCLKKCQHGIKYIISNRHKTEYKSEEVWFSAAMIPIIIYMILYSLFILQVLGQCLRGLQDECSNTAVTSSNFILLIYNTDT